jgi:DNA-directed RNA polymerase specialized sigma subunit
MSTSGVEGGTKDVPEKIPTDTASLYDRWRMDPSGDNLNRVVDSMKGTINYKLGSMGVADNPQMRHQARLYAADAVRKFDPASGANLSTWTQSQLQSLQRFRREQQGPVKIPDRAAIDAWAIERSTRELEDELGYEPDVKQVADKSGLSLRRIAKVRQITRPMAADSQMMTEMSDAPDFLGEALEYVYDGSDRMDRKIIEMTTGYGGSPILQKNQIAQRLGISPSQVTRRTARIGEKLQDLDRELEETHA